MKVQLRHDWNAAVRPSDVGFKRESAPCCLFYQLINLECALSVFVRCIKSPAFSIYAAEAANDPAQAANIL